MLKRANSRLLQRVWLVVALAASSATLSAGSIRGSKHDLSTNATPGSTQVCLVCHTPHRANNTLGPANVPLWNRYVDTSLVFTIYSSSTMDTTPGNPSKGPSAVCLACHDGTLANVTVYGVSGSDKHNLINEPLGDPDYSINCVKCHSQHGVGLPATLRFGKDLRTMHPISMTYPTPAQDFAFKAPTDPKTGWADVKLVNGRVECASCHDVHDPSIVPFLRKTVDGSALCLTCHIK